MNYDFDILVLGGGAAGLVSSGILAHAGARVGLVEKHELGGECLHTGCVPSKALLAAAKAWHRAGRSQDFGLPPLARGTVDLARVMARVKKVVQGIQAHETPDVVRAEGVAEVLMGAARFVDPHTVEVQDRRVTARKFVLCTGSRPVIPPIDGLETIDFQTNETLFDLRTLPARLAVIGGGPIGCEMAQAFARLGSQVQMVEMGPRILPSDDPELAGPLHAILEDEGIDFHLQHRLVRVEPGGNTKRLVLEGPSGPRMIEADEVLLAAGRKANVEGLNLGAAGVELTAAGAVKVNRQLRTSAKHIWALGDVNGQRPFSHMAEVEGRAVAANIAFGLPGSVPRRRIAWCTFTDPELGHAGLTEAQARRRHRRVGVLRFDLEEVDRALAEASGPGLVKVVVAGWRGRVVGASILAPGAGDLLQEWIVAIERRLKAYQVSSLVHVYPGYSLLNQRAADRFAREWADKAWVQSWMKRAYRWFG